MDECRIGRQRVGPATMWTFLQEPAEATEEFTGGTYIFALEKSIQLQGMVVGETPGRGTCGEDVKVHQTHDGGQVR